MGGGGGELVQDCRNPGMQLYGKTDKCVKTKRFREIIFRVKTVLNKMCMYIYGVK